MVLMEASKETWKQCSNCKVIVHNSAFLLHQDCCLNTWNKDPCRLPHNYIWNTVFYSTPKKLNGNEDFPLPREKNCLLLFHSLTMKTLGLVKGSCILVTTDKGQLVFRCWPSILSDESCVVLPAFNLLQHYTSSQFAISTFKGCAKRATNMSLHPDEFKSFMESTSFKTFLTNELSGVLIREDMVLHFNYLEYPCCFTVKTIISSSFEKQILSTDQEPFLKDMCCRLSQINITSNSSFKLDNSVSDSTLNTNSPIRIDKKIRTSTPKSAVRSLHTDSFVSKTFKTINILRLNDTVPSQYEFFIVDSETKVVISVEKSQRECFDNATFEDIGGLDEEITEIKAIVDSVLHQGTSSSKYKSVLISGPSGCGKSTIALALYNWNKVPVYILKQHMLKSIEEDKFQELKKIFKEAEDNSPCIIFIDDIDKLCGTKDDLNKTYKALIADISSKIYNILYTVSNVFIIATAENVNLVPISLRKHNVLEREMKLSVPSTLSREQILLKILKRYCVSLKPEEIAEVSEMAHGFTGGDLKRLCEKAKLSSLLRKNEESSRNAVLTFSDMKESFKYIKPRSMAEFNFEVPNVKWSDIGGMEDVKNAVTEMVDWPLKHASQFKKFKISPSRGILMYGPPGCCKTMIAKALVTESQLNFIPIKGPQLFNKYVGESEKAVSELFKKAKSAAPCVLFFDEIDSLAPARGSTSGNSNVSDRVLTQLLIEIDGVEVLEGVCIIAATNRPDLIDPSLLRPGRFDRMIYVPLPDINTRAEIFKVKLSKMPLAADVDSKILATLSENYTGAEIADICHEAAMAVIKSDVLSKTSFITMENFLEAFDTVLPRTKRELIHFYENYNKRNE